MNIADEAVANIRQADVLHDVRCPTQFLADRHLLGQPQHRRVHQRLPDGQRREKVVMLRNESLASHDL